MKKISHLLLVLSFLVFGSAFKTNAQTGCYTEYKNLFTERGASAIPDGEQEVVITIRDEGKSDCYLGKVVVKDNQITSVVGLKLEDGTYKPLEMKLNKTYKSGSNPTPLSLDIINGMSSSFLSDNNKLVIFINQLSPKAKAYKVAPPASSF
jgi:hypothetical protein